MPFTDFPNGATSFGIPLVGAGNSIPVTNGNYYFVCNRAGANGSDGNTGTDMQNPLATLDGAIGKCDANNADVIVVLPGHSETITGAGGITADIAGVTIVGIGNGTLKPTFLMDGGTTVTFVVSAANVSVSNLVFTAGHSGVVTCFNITAAQCWIDACTFQNNTTNENFVTPIKATSTTDNNADGLKVTNCIWTTIDTDDAEFIEINGNLDRLVVKGNYVRSTSATAAHLVLSAGTKVLTNMDVSNNVHINAMTAGAIMISNGASTNTGVISNNYQGNLDVTGPQLLGPCTGAYWFNNYSTSVVSTNGLSGGINPVADTPTT